MKTIIRITALLILAMTASLGKAQTITITAGSSAVLTAVNSPSLSSPSYSMNPGGVISPSATFVVSPAWSVTYTLYVTGTNSNSAVQTTSNLITVIVIPPVVTQPTIVCASTSSVVTAINSLGLLSPSYSMNPGGSTSPNPTFVITPAIATTYTLYVTGTNSNSAVQTTSNLVTVQVANLPTSSVNPINQGINCGPGIVATVTGTAISPIVNVKHYWYAPGQPVPFVSGGGQTSVYNPIVGTSTYVVVDLSTGCSTSKTVQVVSTAGNYPTFSVTSSGSNNTFTLGCATRSVTDLVIAGGNTVPPGGVISYTVLSPAFTGTNYLTSVTVSNYFLNYPGTYTVIVKDNANLCETRLSLSVIQNTSTPNIAAVVSTQILSCFTPSAVLHGISNTPNVTYSWKKTTLPPLIWDSLYVVSSTPAGASVPSATLIDNYTLTINDNSQYGNSCPSSSVVTMWQNIRPPIASIVSSGTPGVCQNFVTLTDASTLNILPGTFPIGTPTGSNQWQGGLPQTPAMSVPMYAAQVPGIYQLTVFNLSNGCASTASCNVYIGPQVAFSHTVTNGVVTFSDVSTRTGINTTYFWDFGDGNMSTSQNPVHTYTNGGAHLVKFKVTNSLQPFCADSVWQSVTITGVPCNANSNFAMVPTNTAQVWNAIPGYPWNVTAASWSWGDGSSTNGLWTSHQYSAAALYSICLSITVSCVATSTTCVPYNIYHLTQASLVLMVNVVKPEMILQGLSPIEADGSLSWNIAPNPNAGEFQLNVTGVKSGLVRVVISDLTGRLVHDQNIEIESSPKAIDTNHLPSGLYLVTLEADGAKTTKRMIVNH